MKRFLKISLLVWFSLTMPVACHDELASRYEDPKSGKVPSIGEFFTAMLDNDRVRLSYWNVSTFINWHIGVYSQTVGYLNSSSMYQQNESYIQERWDDFYRPNVNGSGVMAIFREIERVYEGLPEKKKVEEGLFLNAGRVVFCDQTAQMVDLWGDIPFSEAGALNATGNIKYPQFDDAEQIYRILIDELDTVSSYFSSASWSPSSLSSFARQDILLFGNTMKWLEYCNSLRLRLLMRISFFDEAYARTEVLKMLDAPDKFPLLDHNDYSPGTSDVLLHPVTTYIYDLHDAFNDWTNYPAPYHALENVLKPVDDLRIPVLYDKYGSRQGDSFVPNEDYNGLPLTLDNIQQRESLQNYAILDSVTFLFNSKLPGVVMTSSEVSFLKAEARERWGGGDPNKEYLNGIRNSIRFYYYLNGLNTIRQSGQKLVVPNNQQIEQFLNDAAGIEYQGSRIEKLEKIWTQKWVHLGFIQAQEAWAEFRRTGYPSLYFQPASLTGYDRPPNRLTYPANEKMYNANYVRVSTKDRRDAKIFWQYR